MDDQNAPRTPLPPAAREGKPCCSARSPGFKIAAVVLAAATVLTATGFLMTRLQRPPATSATGPVKNDEADLAKRGLRLFHNWTKPELALMVSAEQHGYIMPCGCSRPQYGGLERRFNFLQTLKERGWPVLAVDLGDIPQRNGPQALPNVQGLLKYEYSMKALKLMGYTAVGFGEYEMAMPLDRALAQYALNDPSPRVLADNLQERGNFPGAESWIIAQTAGCPFKIGVASVVGPTVRGKVQDPNVRFSEVKDVLPVLLREMDRQKPELRVLLYQGLPKEARACAAAFPQFHIILCLSEYDEPSAQPQRVGETLVVAPGHKGRYVGVVGATRTGKADHPFDLQYQLVSMGEQYATADDKVKGHPILTLLEQYTQELKRDDYLKRYGQTRHPVQVAHQGATYVGSDRCQKCHEQAYTVWKESGHAHA
jgi:2',3'-cyclic-nucleotide 2'-phosphodiesterase (5'-nucleotidase family)